MDGPDAAPGLEVGFRIDMGDSAAELVGLASTMDRVESQVLRDANAIESALGGMVDMGPATSGLKTFANASTGALQALNREQARAGAAAEKMIFSLERQVATFGMTRAAAAALRAEQAGLTDDAARLRAAEAELNTLRTQAAAKADAEAEAIRNAAEAVRAFNAYAAQKMAIYREQQALEEAAIAAAERAVAADQARIASERQLINQLAERAQLETAIARIDGSAQPRATQAGATFSALAAKAADDEAAEQAAKARAASIEQLRGELDPAYAAQKRYDDEVARLNSLRPDLGEDLYTAALKRAEQQLKNGTQTGHGHSTMLGLNTNQTLVATHAARGFAEQLLYTGNVEQAVTAQASHLAAILSLDDGGVAGGFAKVKALVTPTTVAVAAIVGVVVAGTAAWLSYADALEKVNALAKGSGAVIGLTADRFEANAEQAANASNISVKAAAEIQTAYVKMGGIGIDVLAGLTSMTTDFAKATGQDLAGAEQELGRAFQDPAKGADELTEKYGALTQAQAEHIKDLVEQNDRYGAQAALLAALKPQFDGAAEHANIFARAGHAVAEAWSDAWNWIGKAIDRAMGGGSAVQRIADLQSQRQYFQARGMSTAGLDKEVADLQAQLKAEQQKTGSNAARAQSVPVMGMVDGMTGDDQRGKLATQLKQVNDLLRDGGKAAGLNAEQIARAGQAQDMLRHAVSTYLPEGEKQQRLAQLDAQIEAARSPAQKQALTTQRAILEQSGQLITSANAQAIATGKGAKAYAEANKTVENAAMAAAKAAAEHAAELARAAAAQEAQIRNSYALADAYQVSGAAALIAEARVKAESQAIKAKGDIEAAVDRQIRLAIAQRVADGEKSVAAMRDQAAIQEDVNAGIEKGLVPAAQAAEMVRDRMADLPMLAALEAAQQRGLTVEAGKATQALEDQRAARLRLADAESRERLDAAIAGGNDQIAQLEEELRLIGATDAARVHALATLKAEQEATSAKWTGTKGLEWVNQQVKIADLQQRNAQAQDAYNDALSFTADKWDLITRNVQAAGQGMQDAFGSAGKALGDLAGIYASYHADRSRLDQQHDEQLKKASGNQAQIERENQRYALQTSTMQIAGFADAAEAAKGFFKEGSSGYEALQKAEQVFRAVQFALSIRAMAQDAIETGSSIAKSAARTAAHAVEAVVKAISSLPFPLNLAAGAATAAAIAALGVSIAGGFGGGGSKPAPANTGTGTVLGDSSAKSDSLKNAIDALKDVDTTTSVYAREMAASLKSIDDQIGSFSALIARTDNINASAGVSTGFKTDALGSILSAPASLLSHIPVIGGIFGAIGNVISSLFGTKTQVTGSGLYGGSQSVGSINAGGFALQNYSDIEKTHKFLGITTGHSYSTQYASADPTLQSQFTLILKSFDQAIAASAGPLGEATDAVQARLNSFVLNIGKIDLTGLTGDQIKEKLENILSAAADSMAGAAFPGIDKFQQVGEGAFQTLVRVASTVEAVTSSLDELGLSAKAAGIDAKMGIANQFDSLSDMASSTDAYFKAFYTPAEQTAAEAAKLGKVFTSLGVTMPDTLDAFRQLVDAQDLTTAAGQATYAALIQLAPAFADLQSSLQGAKSAADVASERDDLQRQLLELQGNTAAIRALDLAKVDASNRALQEQVWAVQDAQDAAKAAQDLADAWSSVGDSIKAEIDRIRGLDTTAGNGSFASLQGQFNAASAAARAGDQDAAKNLPQLSQALLTAAGSAATSRQELDRVQAQTAASLQATYDAIQRLAAGASTAAASSTDAMLSAAASSQAASTPAAANDDLLTELRALRSEVQQLRSDNNNGHAATAANTGKVARTLDAVTQDSGGTAVSVASAR